jgi:hypothetical protein
MVAGEPGLSSCCRLSFDESVRRPRNWRTEDGRRFCDPGLVGDRPPLAASLVRPRVTGGSVAVESSYALSRGEPTLCCGKMGDLGVGCDDSGPFPGVGGRGVSGGESSGAGIDVPSVSEKLMGSSVNGLNLGGIAAVVGGVPRCNDPEVLGLCQGDCAERAAGRGHPASQGRRRVEAQGGPGRRSLTGFMERCKER